MDASEATRSKMSGTQVRLVRHSECQNWIKLTVDKGVEDGHGTVRDTSVRVDLLEH